MDDLNPEVAAFLADLAQRLKTASMEAGEYSKAMNAAQAAFTKATSKIDLTIDGMDKLNKKVKENTGTMGRFAKEFVTGVKTVQDMTGELKSLNEQLDQVNEQLEELGNATDDETEAKRDALRTMRDQLQVARVTVEQSVKHNIALRATTEGLMKFSNQVATVAAKSVGGFAKGLQDGASAFSLAGGLMEGAFDVANAGAQTIGGALQSAGNAAAMVPGPMRFAGLAASTAGAAISKFGDAVTAAAKFAITFLVKQIEETVDAFNKTSAAGALFTDGMTGMVNAAGDAGLTVKQFSEVLQKNSESFAESGLSVTEGAKQMGRVGKIIKSSGVQDELLRLGYSFTEQADLMAETTANMRRTAGGVVSDEEVATQTEKYATNLRIIADITGQDAKKKVEAAKQENQILAFQAKLSEKSTTQRAQIDAAMATMTEQEKKNFRDRVVLGNVINKEGAIYEANIAGAKQKGEAALALYEANELTAESNARLNAQYGDQIKQSALAATGMQKAGYLGTNSTLTAVNKAGLDAVNQANVYTKDAVGAAKEAVEGQKKSNDQLTNATVTAAQAAQQMAIDLQILVLPRLKDFGELSAKILNSIRDQIADFEDAAGIQDDINRRSMTASEKFINSIDRLGEWIGEMLNKLSFGLVDKLQSWLGNKTTKEEKEARVAADTAKMQARGAKPEVSEKFAATEAAKKAGLVTAEKPVKEPELVATAKVKQQATQEKLKAAEAEFKTAQQKVELAKDTYLKDKSAANFRLHKAAEANAKIAEKNLAVAKAETDAADLKVQAAQSTIAAVEKSKLSAELADAQKASLVDKKALTATAKEAAAAKLRLDDAQLTYEKDKSAANKKKFDEAAKEAKDAENAREIAKLTEQESSLKVASIKGKMEAIEYGVPVSKDAVMAAATGGKDTGAASPALAGGKDTSAGAGPGGPVQGSTAQVLATIKKRESGGNYEAQAKGSTASGAYQFINSTWQSLAKKFGVGGEYQTAKQAPPNVQDTVAGKYVDDILNKNKGDVSKVPLVWYTGNAQGQMSSAALAANAGLTPGQYQAKWMADFNKIAGKPEGNKVQAAEGGIASGPKSGYPATLHGEEAIVPLNKDKPVPVQMDLSELTELLTEMVRTLKDQNYTSQKILQASA